MRATLKRSLQRQGPPQAANGLPTARTQVRGKFFYRGSEKQYIRGVTYGTFAPGCDGSGYPAAETLDRDFAQMAANGINALRTYTVPPRRLLDAAQRHGLLVMVGLAWEQHVAFLDHAGRAEDIERRVREGIRSCAGHPAVLAYSIANEIPAPVVRWHGKRRVERFLERLYRAAKLEDPAALVTYVNYPTTEYLELPFLDFVCFNVYLEEQSQLEAYLARLHNLAGERPLVMAEIGLDSRRNGEAAQAESVGWQVRSAFSAGCAGAFVFAWTDDWYVTHLGEDGRGQGGSEIADWDFGLTTRDRVPKAALAAVRDAYAEVPFPREEEWPRISVVVCSYNGERTLAETCRRLQELDYPDYEVILVDDGSTDATAAIACEHGCRLIRTENRGLSAARNTGMVAATGEIVAYIDDDAYPDPHWLAYLAAAYRAGDYVGVGGPNLAPDDDGPTAACIARAPGNPVHVLLSDREAEHIPGCNSSFRKSALQAVGGFDARFRVAGDDVDLCWRLREAGGKLGYSPSGVVWHHRRPSLRAYWRQQRGYGKAEALLERKWPQKYNAAGHLAWCGRLYGGGPVRSLWRRQRIYHGTWGIAPFQSLYERHPGSLGSLPTMPEWYLVIALLIALSLLGLDWPPLLAALPLLALATASSAAHALSAATASRCVERSNGRQSRLRARVAALFLMQPLARLVGRLRHGLAPWRLAPRHRRAPPIPRDSVIWSERPRSQEQRLAEIESSIRLAGVPVLRGREFDRWDLVVRSGGLACTAMRMAIEEHGAGRQLVRIRVSPRPSLPAVVVSLASGIVALVAAASGGPIAAAVLASSAVFLVVVTIAEAAAETGHALAAIELHAAEERLPRESSAPALARETAAFAGGSR
jgi:O-antigen biosynthesis protein